MDHHGVAGTISSCITVCATTNKFTFISTVELLFLLVYNLSETRTWDLAWQQLGFNQKNYVGYCSTVTSDNSLQISGHWMKFIAKCLQIFPLPENSLCRERKKVVVGDRGVVEGGVR